jgi:hypothetical protein
MTKKKNTKKIPPNKSSSLPNGVTEEEFLKVLDDISKRLGHKFKFGYHDFDDMKQQAAIFALEGLEKYDNSRPLENFLWTHVRNRLFNYKRDNYQRPDKPCLSCPLYDPHCKKSLSGCLDFQNKSDCELYAAWENRNNSKKNIMKPIGIEDSEDYGSKHHTKGDISDLALNKEIINLLDEKMPAAHRESYLKLKYGEKLNKSDLNRLILIIKEIINDSNLSE